MHLILFDLNKVLRKAGLIGPEYQQGNWIRNVKQSVQVHGPPRKWWNQNSTCTSWHLISCFPAVCVVRLDEESHWEKCENSYNKRKLTFTSLFCLFIYQIRGPTRHACLVAQLCPTLCNPVDCSLPGSSDRGILQARILECVVISFSRASSWLRDRTHISCLSCIAGSFFTFWAIWETITGC